MKKSKEEERVDKLFERVRKGLGLKQGDIQFQEGELIGKLTPLGIVIYHTIYTVLDDVKKERENIPMDSQVTN